MRTAKKTLCLALVLAMMLSLCVFASADVEKVEDYADFADIPEQYAQAATILTALEVFQGYEEDDSFHGENLLTRAQGAKILAVLMGYKDAMTPAEIIPNFEDMKGESNHWATPYVNYLADTGIIHGKSDTVFDPEGELTGTQFAKMLLTALGYDAEKEGLVGPGWDAKTARLALSADSYLIPDEADYGKFPWNENINRYTAAQMAYTTLLLPLVKYGGDSWELETSSNRANQTISSAVANGGMFMVEFAERYFPDLVRDTHAGDEFGTPVTSWKLKGNVISERAPKAVFTSTEGVTGKEIADQYAHLRIGNNTQGARGAVTVYIDGVEYYIAPKDVAKAEVSSQLSESLEMGLEDLEEGTGIYDYVCGDYGVIEILSKIYDENSKDDITGNGTLVNVYIDNESYVGSRAGSEGQDVERTSLVTVVIVHTWLAKATGDYKNDSARMTVIMDPTTKHIGTAYTAEKGDIEEIKSGDDLLVNITNPFDLADDVDNEVVIVKPATVSKGVFVSGFSADDGVKMETVTVEGEDIDASELAYTNSEILYDYDNVELYGFSYDVYCDAYGYVIGVEYSNTDTSYVFITGYHASGSNLGAGTYEVNAIWPDGTMDKQLKVTASGTAKALLNENALQQIGFETEAQDGSPVLNVWFLCSKDANGNVELRNVVGAKFAADGRTIIPTDVKQSAAVKSGTAVKGSDVSWVNNRYAYGNSTYALSNDSTVFILAKANDDVGGGAITGVSEVVKGYKKVSVDVTDLADTAELDFDESKTGEPNNFLKMNGGVDWGKYFIDTRAGSAEAFDTYFIYKGDIVLYAVTVPESASGNVVYITSTQKKAYTDPETGENFAEYDAIYNGEKITLAVNTTEAGTNRLFPKNMYQVVFDDDGIVIDFDNGGLPLGETAWDASDPDTIKDDGYFINETLLDNGYQVSYDASVLYITDTDEEGDVAEGSEELHMNDDAVIYAASVEIEKNGSAKAYEEFSSVDEAVNVATAGKNEIYKILAEVDSDGKVTTLIILYDEV